MNEALQYIRIKNASEPKMSEWPPDRLEETDNPDSKPSFVVRFWRKVLIWIKAELKRKNDLTYEHWECLESKPRRRSDFYHK